MMMHSLLAVGFLMHLVAVLTVLVALALIFIVLLQKGRGGGLSGALGGGIASGLLGSKTGDALTWVTVSLVAAFMVLVVLMAKFYRPSISGGAPVQTPPAQTAPVDMGDAEMPLDEAAAAVEDVAADAAEAVETMDVPETELPAADVNAVTN